MIRDCNLEDFLESKTGVLSPGTVRKLTVAMALVGRPRLVVLDNPVAGLDPTSKRQMIKTILKYTEGRGLIMATRDVEVAEAVGDRLAIMHKGNFVAIGTQSEVIDNHGKGYAIEILIDESKMQK